MNYTVKVLLPEGEELKFTDIEADSEKAAIEQVSEFEDDFVIFKQDSTYYKINEDMLVGFKVTSGSNGGSDSDDDDPVKQVIN